MQWRITDFTDVTDSMTRWPLLCRLLRDPERESRRLAALLERWRPAAVRRHLLVDDCRRREWQRA